MNSKQKISRNRSTKKRFSLKISKSKIEWIILVILLILIPLGIWSNLFSYEYYYFKCQGQPMELEGKYYRIPGDKGYGIHHGSDYHICSYAQPPGYQRDPSTLAGAVQIREANQLYKQEHPLPNYTVYVPSGYKISEITTGEQGGQPETTFYLTTSTGIHFTVYELQKDGDFSYTNLCSKPAQVNWSGTIIGHDSAGREICKTNPSKYVTDYIVGVNIGNTGLMLETANNPNVDLNAQATAIFSSMKPYKN